jgi:hypothetical protein
MDDRRMVQPIGLAKERPDFVSGGSDNSGFREIDIGPQSINEKGINTDIPAISVINELVGKVKNEMQGEAEIPEEEA